MKRDVEIFLENYISQLHLAGAELKQQRMPQLTEELFGGFEATGNRLEYEKVYFLRRKHLAVFGILTAICGEEQYLGRLETILSSICQEECWALPAHVDRKNNRNWRITIDLFAAETACTLAELAGRLKGRLSKDIDALVRQEVCRRVLVPFEESDKPYASWETSKDNWCAVCNGSIGMAAMWLLEPGERLERMLERIGSSIENYVDGFCRDGSCLEGLGYYTYGLSYYTAFADMMEQHSAGAVNLMSRRKMREIALFQQKCYPDSKASVSFSDSNPNERFRVGLTAYLSLKWNEVRFPSFHMAAGLETDNCYRYLILSRDIILAKRYLRDFCEQKPKLHGKEREHIVLPDAQWSICRSANETVFAIKGGTNDEPHNHNDVGSFLYACRGIQVLADLGAGEYTKSYFGPGRYENICCRSLGHNVPLIDGMEQKAGECFGATYFCADGAGNAVIEIGGAYELFDDEKVTRAVAFNLCSGSCSIADEFLLRDGRCVEENLVSIFEPELVEDGFLIRIQGETYEISCTNGAKYRIIPAHYSDHFGIEQPIWMLRWTVVGSRAAIRIDKRSRV